MKIAPQSNNENERIKELLRYNILDTGFEAEYDDLTALASYICDTPIALISLIDPKRQWFKSRVGIDVQETSRDFAFCAHAILQNQVLVIPDTLQDERFYDNPLVTSAPHIRFYAGVPLVTDSGLALGTICAIDQKPRQLDEKQLQALKVLANQVMTHLELRLSVTQLEKYAQELHDSNLSKDKFFSIISHDLRAPFNGILSLSEMLANDFDTFDKSEIKEFATDIFRSAKTAYDLVDNLLSWSRLETGDLNFEPDLLQLAPLIATVTSLLHGIAAQKLIEIDVQFDDPEIFVYCDRNMIYSVLQNLIANSIKFTPSNGKIQISSHVQEGWLQISIKDTGIGIKEEDLQNLFRLNKPFSTKGTAGETGTGLGLMLCKQFIEKNGGKFWVISKPELGSTFNFTLPRASSI